MNSITTSGNHPTTDDIDTTTWIHNYYSPRIQEALELRKMIYGHDTPLHIIAHSQWGIIASWFLMQHLLPWDTLTLFA